jgi:hypothetical protein
MHSFEITRVPSEVSTLHSEFSDVIFDSFKNRFKTSSFESVCPFESDYPLEFLSDDRYAKTIDAMAKIIAMQVKWLNFSPNNK